MGFNQARTRLADARERFKAVLDFAIHQDDYASTCGYILKNVLLSAKVGAIEGDSEVAGPQLEAIGIDSLIRVRPGARELTAVQECIVVEPKRLHFQGSLPPEEH